MALTLRLTGGRIEMGNGVWEMGGKWGQISIFDYNLGSTAIGKQYRE